MQLPGQFSSTASSSSCQELFALGTKQVTTLMHGPGSTDVLQQYCNLVTHSILPGK